MKVNKEKTCIWCVNRMECEKYCLWLRDSMDFKPPRVGECVNYDEGDGAIQNGDNSRK